MATQNTEELTVASMVASMPAGEATNRAFLVDANFLRNAFGSTWYDPVQTLIGTNLGINSNSEMCC